MTTDDKAQFRTYGQWTKPRNEGLWGLAWPVTMAMFVAIVIVMLTVMLAGIKVAIAVAILALLVLAPLAWSHDNQTGYERGILMFQWVRTVLRRENIYASGVFSKLGTTRLPGLMADSQLYEDTHSAGFRFGMVHVPAFDLYTVSVRCWPQGARAVDQAMIDQWVASWGQMLASLGSAPDVEAITAVIDTVPETGNRLATEIATLTDKNAPAMAKAMMWELGETLPSNTIRMEAWCSVTYRASSGGRRKEPAEQALEIGRRLPGIIGALSDAGVRARPMTADEITAVMRRAWDPAAEPDLEEASEGDQSHEIDWTAAGPVAYEEHKDKIWHDGVTSVCWEMTSAPSGNINEQALKRLLEANPEVPRKRVAIIYRPHSGGDATKIVDDDFKNALVATQSSRGIVSAAASLRVGATSQAREEQARGHGVTRFGVLITVTALNDSDVPRIDAIVKDMTVQTRLRIRRSYRYQAAAFAAGLGTGVLLPEMSSLPRTVSE
ncbi:SCO6880 family protein [Nocardia salmonicida]|uniref:SCO6880 family protein n=1 Tax=Nocardia salmonicida TaxID=53431 RepID=UPI0037B42748